MFRVLGCSAGKGIGMFRLGVTQRVDVIEAYGERRDALDQAWGELLAAHDYCCMPLPNRISEPASFVDSLRLEGILLTGGNDLEGTPGATGTAPERDALEHALLELAAARHLPVFAICRGLQMLVTHHGGTLTPIEGHVATLHPIRVRPDAGLPLTEREVNSFHGFAIRQEDLPECLAVVATSDDGYVEAVRHRELPQWGVMWHPERSPKDPRDVELMNALFREGSP